MAVRDWAAKVWRSLVGSSPETTELGQKGGRTHYFQSPWVRFYQRKALWNDLDTMDKDDPIAARGLDFIARFATQFERGESVGFMLEGPEDELALLNPLANRLQPDVFEWTRYATKFGDNFIELVVSEDMEVVGAKMFPYSYQINVNKDKYGGLMTGDPQAAMKTKTAGLAAYDQLDDNGQLVAAFWPLQIVQLGFGNKQGLSYHEPLLACFTSGWKRLRATEDSLAIGRLTRSWPQRIHRIPVPLGLREDEVAGKIRQYRDMIGSDVTVPYDESTSEFAMSSRDTPPAVDTAYYLPRHYTADGTRTVDGDVENLEAANPNLNALEDVYLLLRRFLCAMGVPADFLNLSVGQRAFIDRTTPEKREAFLYTECALQLALRGALRQIFDTQLLLHGINPLQAQYQIVLPPISPFEVEVATNIQLKRAQTAIMWQTLGIPTEVVGRKVLQMSQSEIQAWVGSGGMTPPKSKTAKQQAEEWFASAKMQFDAEPVLERF